MKATTLTALGAMVLGILLAGGCFSPNVNVDTKGWQDVAKSYRDDHAGPDGPPKPLSEKDAVKLARSRAEKEGLDDDDLDKYRVVAKKREGFWWVDFALRSSDRLGWPDHFTVRVSEDRTTILLKGR